jgi:sec-independent protein translocase protein TatA
MPLPSGMELIVIAVIIVAILLWGPKKLPELAKSIGLAKKEFEKVQKDGETFTTQAMTSPPSTDDVLIKTAKELGISTEGKTKDQISQEIVEKSKQAKS